MLTSVNDSDVLDSETREIIDKRKEGITASHIRSTRYDPRNGYAELDGNYNFNYYS